jgi:PAS domain S-box-containing protein
MNSDKNNNEEILIVEDSLTQAEQLKFLLEKHKYNVSVAYNGKEALEIIEKRKPGIVISDIVMPEMDGYELCRHIKENADLKEIPVILLTVLSDPEDVLKGLVVGADNFFTKPYEEDYLIARIQYMFANRALREKEKGEIGIKIFFGNQEYYITSERQQILNLLLSTYETAVQKNIELQKTQEELKALNEQLEIKVEERTTSLRAEVEVRKRTEDELSNVNRALKTLSGVNKALVRSTDESELFHSVCRITVEIGGYRQAWIGLVEQEKIKTIRPAAQYGYEEGFLETINIKEAERKNPALGEAIRTGRPGIVKNILTDQNKEQCRSEAVRRGYASCIAIPFKVNNQLFGLLNIFAKEPDAFDADEVKLLAEMADDLAYGVTALHIREKHRLAKEELQQSEEKYRALMDNAGDPIILMDMQGNLLEINRKTESLLGRRNEEVFNKHFSRFIPEKDLERTIAAFEDLIHEGGGALSDVDLLKKDGTTVPVDITGSIIQFAGKKVVQSIFRDITERKRAEESLRESEERYRRLVMFSPYGIAIHSEGKLVYMNLAGAKILGMEDPNELVGKMLLQIIHPDYHELVKNRIRIQEEGNVVPPLEEKFLRPDGTSVDVEIASIPFTYMGKLAMYGVFRDITERKQAEVIQRKLSSAVEHTADIVTIARKDGTIEYVNPAFEKITGYNMGEAVGKTPRILKSGKQDKQFYENLWGTILSGKVFYGVLINKKNNGEMYYAEKTITPVKDERGTITHFVSTDKDITERKRAEEITKESEVKFRNLVEKSLAGVYIIQNEKFSYVNPKLAEIFGYTQDEIISSKSVSDLVAKDDSSLVAENIRKRLQGEVQSIYYTFRGQRKDGELIDVEVYGTKIEYNGKPAVIGTLLDITGRKKAEKIHLENLRLEAADKAKSDFLANMSHELRTPLNASIGFSELLKQGMGGELSEKQKHYVDNILTSSQFLLALINDILDLSRIEAGRIDLKPEKMSVALTVNETLSLIKEKAMKHNLVLKTEFDPELEFIEADKQRFKQILFNLLSNAVKFSKEEGGTVTIRAEKEGDMAQISVSDTGIGIKEENIGRLFHKFEQLDSGTSRKYGGTGLGLSITKQLVELHGGTITAQSKYGEGSTFTFTMPLIAKK